MKGQLRVVAETAAIGTLAMSLSVIAMLGSLPILNFLGLGFLGTVWIAACILLPYAAAFYYGYRRRLQFRFLMVWIGWIIGSFVAGSIVGATVLRHIHLHAHKALTPWLWLNWLLTIGWNLLFALMPTLTTMWGQRLRLRALRPSD